MLMTIFNVDKSTTIGQHVRPDSLLRCCRYINYLLTYLLNNRNLGLNCNSDKESHTL